jgi:hypothetical protein
MDNPYDLPWIIVGIASGVLAALLPARKRKRLARAAVFALGTFLCWRITLSWVEWAFAHPFNPDDGAAKTFVYLFGWLPGLVILILPSFALVLLVRFVHERQRRRSGAGSGH